LAQEVLGVTLSGATLASLVEDDHARADLANAEAALAQADFTGAVKHAAIAWEVARRNFHLRDTRVRPWARRLREGLLKGALPSGLGMSFPNREFEQAASEFLEVLEIARYGIRNDEYARFKAIAPELIWMVNGERPRVDGPAQRVPSHADASFVCDFVGRALLARQRASRLPMR
jgi:hypothetical protein